MNDHESSRRQRTCPRWTFTGTLTFDPVPTGTRMHWLWDVEPIGSLRLMKTLVTSIGRHQEQTIWTSLKHHLEEKAN